MPDDKSKPGGQDRKRININEDYEVRDWAKKFGVSQDQLKAAGRSGQRRRETSERQSRIPQLRVR
jgi:hypothetical protein